MPAVNDTSPILGLAVIDHLELLHEQFEEIYIPLAQSLSVELNQGESEAITLVVDLGVKIIVMDERMGRERARDLGLKTVGVLGILLTAKKQGRIKSLKMQWLICEMKSASSFQMNSTTRCCHKLVRKCNDIEN